MERYLEALLAKQQQAFQTQLEAALQKDREERRRTDTTLDDERRQREAIIMVNEKTRSERK